LIMPGRRPKQGGNRNRAEIRGLIETCPGLTMCDISRALGLNKGTVRYHLAILLLSHEITSFDDGEKFVRYFRNDGRCSEEEKLIISLARRESVKRIMDAIAACPGISGAGLARNVGLSECVVCRQMRLLIEKNVVVKAGTPGGGTVYRFSRPFLAILATQNTAGMAEFGGTGNAR